jgi:putative transposase
MKNGYYQRNLDTQYGRIEGLWSRDPYQRNKGRLEEALIKMYQSDMSTREIGKFIERILGDAYFPTTTFLYEIILPINPMMDQFSCTITKS